MITLKELGYVNQLAFKVPYPGIQYAKDATNQLIKAVDEYKKHYKDKQYDLILSDGNEFTFEIMTKNLCHMLGVDFKNLTNDYNTIFRYEILGLTGNSTSYDLLNAIIDNIDKVLKYDYDNGNRILNYYRIMIKSTIFQKLSDFTQFNFGVINFDKEIYQKNNENTNHSGNTEKFLYVQSNESNCPYFMMGILKDNNYNQYEEGNYVVETLLAPTNVRSFFNGQRVTIPTQILVIDDLMNKYEASPREKLALINQYKSIILSYNLENNLDTFGDYLAMLSQQDNSSLNPKLTLK